MNRIARIALLAAALALATSGAALADTISPSGRMATETRAVSGFNSVSISVPGTMKITQGKGESLSVTADDSVLPYIETVVEQGLLRIRYRKPFRGDALTFVKGEKISITLAARDLEAIAIAGAANVAAGPLKATRLVVSIAGSGNLDVESVAAEDVSVGIGGSGDLAIRGGRTDFLGIRIGGSGDIKAGKLESKRTKIRIAGSGDATLWARDALDVSVAGSGSVRYYGDPKVERKVAGSGDVRRLGASPS